MATKRYSSATQDARGNWWSSYTDPDTGETKRIAVQGPSQDFETGETSYGQYSPDQQSNIGSQYSGYQTANLGGDSFRWNPGDVVSPEEFASLYQKISNPTFTKGMDGGFTQQQYLNDPRSVIRQENGQLVYRPDMAQGDFDPKNIGGSGFLNLAKGFITSPGIMTMMPAIMGGIGALSGMTGAGAAAMGSAEFPTFMGEAAGGLGSVGSAGGAASTLPDSYWNMVADATGNTVSDASSGLGSFGGVDFAGASTSASNPFAVGGFPSTFGPNAPLDQMIGSLSGGGQLAVGGLGGLESSLGSVAASGGFPAIRDILQTAGTVGSVAGGGSQIGGKSNRETGAEAAARILKGLGVDVAPGTLGLLGQLGATGLGIYGANQQQNSYEKLARDFMDMGAPYRAELSNLVTNPSSFYGSPVVQGALQQGSDALARSLSAKVGNPILNPTSLQEMQNYTSRGLLDQYNNQFRNLAAAGGLGVSQASGLGSQAVASQAGVPNAIGAGLSTVFGNQRDYAGELVDLLRSAAQRGQIGTSLLSPPGG